MKRRHNEGFTHLLLLLIVLIIGIAGYFTLKKTDLPKLAVTFPNKEETQVQESTTQNVEIDTSRTLFYDPLEFTYQFIEDHNTYLVSKPGKTNQMSSRIQELGFYNRDNDNYNPIYKSTHAELRYTLSPKKDYLLVADVIYDPNSQIKYQLVKSMRIVNLKTSDTISVPFPVNRQYAGALWKLEENKIYISAARPEGMDYAFTEYYEFNLNSKDFKLIATSDDFVLEYGDNEKKFAHFILGFSGFDSTRTNIIGVGQAPEDPRLLTVWKINPNTRSFTKIYDYNTDTKYDWLVTDRYIDDRHFKDDKLEVRSRTQRYSLNLNNGTITDLKQEYNSQAPYVPEFDVEGYEYVRHTRDPWHYTLKNLNTQKEHTFITIENDSYRGYRIITVLD